MSHWTTDKATTIPKDAVLDTDTEAPINQEIETGVKDVVILIGRNVDIDLNDDGTINYLSRKNISVDDDMVATMLSRMSVPKKAIQLFTWRELTEANNRVLKLFYNRKKNSCQLATNVDIGKSVNALIKSGYRYNNPSKRSNHVKLSNPIAPLASYHISYTKMGYRTAWYEVELPDGRILKASGSKPSVDILPLIWSRVCGILESIASVREAVLGGPDFVEAADTKTLGVVTLTEIPDNTRSILPSGIPLIDVCLSSMSIAKEVITQGPDLPGADEEDLTSPEEEK